MVDIITSFFTWTTLILQTFLNLEIIDGFKFIHIVLFIGIVTVLVRFIIKRRSKNDKSE